MLLLTVPVLWSGNLWADSANSTYWDTQPFVTGATKNYQAANLVGGSMSVVAVSRTTPAGTREDLAEFAFHWSVEAISGMPSAPLTGAQATSVESLILTFWSTMRPSIYQDWAINAVSWRDFRADFPLNKDGTSKYSPVWRTTGYAQAGTQATGSRIPDQCSATATFLTGSRRHWGRIYFPGLGTPSLGSFGRLATSYSDLLASSLRTMMNGAAALPATTDLVIWSPKYRGIMGIRMLQVDDIVDIQRRRRAKQATYRRQYTS